MQVVGSYIVRREKERLRETGAEIDTCKLLGVILLGEREIKRDRCRD